MFCKNKKSTSILFGLRATEKITKNTKMAELNTGDDGGKKVVR
jgi:hypothetical protein